VISRETDSLETVDRPTSPGRQQYAVATAILLESWLLIVESTSSRSTQFSRTDHEQERGRPAERHDVRRLWRVASRSHAGVTVTPAFGTVNSVLGVVTGEPYG